MLIFIVVWLFGAFEIILYFDCLEFVDRFCGHPTCSIRVSPGQRLRKFELES